MFSFFRKIRQQLLANNRLRKYLLYAFGEIILVVIGILIALQLNLWNEERKTAKSHRELMGLLIVDLEDKKREIADDIDVFTNYLTRYQEFRIRWETSRTIDTANLKQVIRQSTQDHWLFNTDTPTYTNSLDAELWKSLPDSLTRQISRLYYADFGFMKNYTEQIVEYHAACKLNYMRPNQLLGEALSIEEKKKRIEKNPEELLTYISLLEYHLIRMRNQWQLCDINLGEVIGNIEGYLREMETN